MDYVKVTVHDAKDHGAVLGELPAGPFGLPCIGSQIRFPRHGWNPTQPWLRVVDILWDLDPEETGEPEIRVLVQAD